MRIPKAPSWTVVFLFGAAWNLFISRYTPGVFICLGLTAISLVVNYERSRSV